MMSDLSIFAARLRDYISICAGEPEFASAEIEPALQAHHDAEFNGMALVLFALQFHHNAPYRKFCQSRNVAPDSITHWTQIPAVPTAAFKDLELTCLPPEARTTVFHSSGTTEQRPSRHFHFPESLSIYEASLWPWFERHVLSDLIPDTPRLTLLTPSPSESPSSSLVHMFEVVRRKLGAPSSAFVGEIAGDGAWTLNFEKALSALRQSAAEGRPLVLIGTAFSFVHLLDQLAEQGVRLTLPDGSCVMETGGYKGRSRALPKAELHSLITERLGVPPSRIVCEYGMSELSSQAYDRPIQNSKFKIQKWTRLFRFPLWARIRVTSPETGQAVAEGEAGLLHVFDLANVFSVMALQTEDLAVQRKQGFELIGRAESAEPRGCSLMAQSAIRNRQSAIK